MESSINRHPPMTMSFQENLSTLAECEFVYEYTSKKWKEKIRDKKLGEKYKAHNVWKTDVGLEWMKKKINK